MDTQNKKVLIIDDEPALLVGLSAYMKRAGYQVVTATNGSAGLQEIRSDHPDVIICDVMMPAPNGFELRQLLSQDPDTLHIPFIFLTARGDQEDKVMGIQSGADDYITKPFDRDELIARVAAVLRRAEISRQIGQSQAQEAASEQMEMVRAEFLKNFHHELRTPLTKILGLLELVLTDKFETSEEQVEFLKMTMNSAQDLHSLVEDVISLTDIDQGQVNTFRQEINLEASFYKPLNHLLDRYEEKNLDVETNVKVVETIHAPRKGFKQATMHIIDNALKFSPEGGHVQIDLLGNGKGGCILKVTDEGLGIPKNQREKVFERFYQIEQGDTRSYGGLGVGLTIAQAFAQSLGGDVVIEDVESGCQVQMVIPSGQSDWKPA
jgi:two-component system sensor histidine kinase/response regulator